MSSTIQFMTTYIFTGEIERPLLVKVTKIQVNRRSGVSQTPSGLL
jgi:hypothetical protein